MRDAVPASSERKARFGVSLPADLARELDRASRRLGSTRSSIVEEALRSYLSELEHLEEPHECRGVILATCRGANAGEVASNYKDIVVGHLHVHLMGDCTDIIAVAGPSSSIEMLVRDLRSQGCSTRYTPLPHPAGPGK